MGVKVVFPFLMFVVSFSCVTMYDDTTRICTPELRKKLIKDKVSCSCRQDKIHGFFVLECGGATNSFHDVLPALRNAFPENNELKLSFTFNAPFNVSSNYFEGFNISSLTFEKCRIKNISDGDLKPAFVGLEDTLEYLEINNCLETPRRKFPDFREEPLSFTLGHLRRLREFKVHHNELWHIDNNMFPGGSKSLEILDVSYNRIYDLGDRAFANLPNLKELNLGSNKIRVLKRSMLPNPAYLEKIDFEGNVIRELPFDIFDNMPFLHTLHLYVNEIRHMHERTWMTIWSHLEELEIQGNPILCDDTLDWFFAARKLSYLRGECGSPYELNNKDLQELQDEMKKKMKDES